MLVTSVTSPCKITCSRLANLICGNLVAPLVEPVQNARTSLLDAALGRTACKTALLVFSHVLLSLCLLLHTCVSSQGCSVVQLISSSLSWSASVL